MKKCFQYFLMIMCCLSVAGCEIASTDMPSASPVTQNSISDHSSPLGIKIVGDDANGNPIIQTFDYTAKSARATEPSPERATERSSYYSQIEEDRHDKETYQKLFVSKMAVPISLKDEDIIVLKAVDTKITNAINVKAARLLSALYICNYKEARQMKANIEAIYEPLLMPESIENLQQSDFAYKHATEMVDGGIYSYPTESYYNAQYGDGIIREHQTVDGATLYSILYQFTLHIIPREDETVPKYITANKIHWQDQISSMNGETKHDFTCTFTVNVFFTSLDADAKILSWEQTYVQALAQRYCSVYTGEIEQGEKIFYTSPSPKDFPMYWDSINEKDFEYQDIIATLNTSTFQLFNLFNTNAKSIEDDHFQPFLDAAAPEFKAYLQQSKFFDALIADIRKDSITIEFSEYFNSTVSAHFSGHCYATEEYGDVYAIHCTVPIKSGNDTFNKKYGLPKDIDNMEIHFFYSKIQNALKLIGFCIVDPDEQFYLESENMYQAYLVTAWETGEQG